MLHQSGTANLDTQNRFGSRKLLFLQTLAFSCYSYTMVHFAKKIAKTAPHLKVGAQNYTNLHLFSLPLLQKQKCLNSMEPPLHRCKVVT